MRSDWVLTQDAFEALLGWLDSDRELAGQKYEMVRLRLIKIFTCRGCGEPEDLADETINRVSVRLKDIEKDFVGDPLRYFCGVANKVHLEYLRRRPQPTVPLPAPVDDDEDTTEQELQCLERCLKTLTPTNRHLVVQYYQDERRAKIEHRKHLADELGIALNALRIRAHRIRLTLQNCVQNCVSQV